MTNPIPAVSPTLGRSIECIDDVKALWRAHFADQPVPLGPPELPPVPRTVQDQAREEFLRVAGQWAERLAELADELTPAELFAQWVAAGRQLRCLLTAAEEADEIHIEVPGDEIPAGGIAA